MKIIYNITIYVSIILSSISLSAQQPPNYLMESIENAYFDYFDGIKKTINLAGTTPSPINIEYHLSSGDVTYSAQYQNQKRVFMKGALKNGKPHGEFIEYNLETGKIKKRGQFENGLLHGRVIEYTEEGVFILQYNQGTLEYRTLYEEEEESILVGNFS